ncbi:MAG: dTMP kinase [Methermicoccaceae archaeon]
MAEPNRECEYYPCHFEGQVCDYCYCPFYPCGDYELGFWLIGRKGRVVWSCIDCHLLHLKPIAEYYAAHPDADVPELKTLARKLGLVYKGDKSEWFRGVIVGRKGVLIAIEGIDGAGKSTHAALLKEALEREGYEVVLLKEPTAGVWGMRIRELARHGRSAPASEELELFLKDREENAKSHILPALKEGKVVIMDRYYPSSMAYQGALGLDPEHIRQMSERIAPRPDLVVVLDVPPEIGVGRVRDRGEAPDHFEDTEYLRKVRNIFIQMVQEGMGTLVDATLPVEDVHARIIELLKRSVLRHPHQE